MNEGHLQIIQKRLKSFVDNGCDKPDLESLLEYVNNCLEEAKPKNSCPICNDGRVIDLPSIDSRLCLGCNTRFEWKLKPGQKSLTVKGKVGGLP